MSSRPALRKASAAEEVVARGAGKAGLHQHQGSLPPDQRHHCHHHRQLWRHSFAYIPFCYKYKLRKFCVSGWFALLPIEHMPFVGLHKPQGQGHSWKNTRTAQTRLCYFSGLLCYFFASRHATTVLLHFAVKVDIWDGWVYSVSYTPCLRGGQTWFLMVLRTILRQTLNYCACAICSRERFVCAIFYPFWPDQALFM